MQKNCSVVILAAGKSGRMGTQKLALVLDNNNTFLENLIKQYLDFECKDIIVVVNNEGKAYLDKSPLREQFKFTIALNEYPERERFFSLKTGLQKTKGSKSVFIHNVDNPFANGNVLDALFKNKAAADFVKPQFMGKGGHPILISNKIVRDVIAFTDYKIHLNKFLERYSCKEIETRDENILININTKDEYLNL